MKKFFAIVITDFCTRECSHCIHDSTSDGKALSIKHIESAIIQIAALVKEHPDRYRDRVDITGGEVLLYSHDGNNLGNVIDVIHKHGLKVKLTTRGWTNHEKEQNKLPYRNFLALKAQLSTNYNPIVSISCDLYSFHGKRQKLAQEMTQNALEAFLQAGCSVILYCTISKESFHKTYAALLCLMKKMNFHLSDRCKNFFSMSTEEVFRKITEYYQLKKSVPKADAGEENRERLQNTINALQEKCQVCFDHPILTFEELQGKTVFIEFNGFFREGRGKVLPETPPFSPMYCNVPTPSHDIFVIRNDMGVLPCCSCNFKLLPEIGNLKKESLIDIIKKLANYATAIEKMQESISLEERRRQHGICSLCPDTLPSFLKISPLTDEALSLVEESVLEDV